MKNQKLFFGLVLVLAAVALAFFGVPGSEGAALALTAPIVSPSGFTPIQEALLAYLKNNNPEMAQKFMNKQLRAKDDCIYITRKVDADGGIVEYLNSTVAKSVGTTNVDKGQLDKDTAFAFDRIKVLYADSGAAGTDLNAITTWTTDVNSWSAALCNGEVEVLQDDNVLINIPAIECGTLDLGLAFDGFQLKNPIVLDPEKQIIIRVKYANGLTVNAANTEYVKVILGGMSTRRRGNV